MLTWPTITPRTFTSALAGSCMPAVLVVSVTSSNAVNFWVKTALTSQTPSDQQADEDDTEDAVVVEGSSSPQPANLTVVVEPQMAIDRNRSITLTATIEVRTARPTATPTPAGPPLAV